MLTPQNIREKTFEKAVFGGYDMGTVDNFLDEIANDFELLAKENATLKGKMKVLVNKIEEYRSNEDALRAAMISAQKLGTMIEQEARAKSEQMTTDATAEAEKIVRDAKLELEVERARLAEAKDASARYIENMELLCRRQSETLQRLRAMQLTAPSTDAAEAPQPQTAVPQPDSAAAATRAFNAVTPEPEAEISDLFSIV
ncbi:MAG: DivIVA domain-containing protein [Oscillospiraceae bacterium]|nr:DivIVA domain-containing protein [Oscillospiraceae bacterium]MCD8066902.1 DivIVA domain-containing protein [Oscillospiraceae bacterium]MCD8191833.1 DivIVA domain-containing protein [Oscillospiraceae bacterium]